MNETLEEIDFARDRVIEMSVGYGYMIVYTATHDSYTARRIGTLSHIFDLQTTVNLIEAALLSKVSKMHSEFLNKLNLSGHRNVGYRSLEGFNRDIIGIADSKLVTWMYANMVFVDRTVLTEVIELQDGSNFLKLPTITSFTGSSITARRQDGNIHSSYHCSISPHDLRIHISRDWDKAVRF
uniref:Intraflagellar Transport protein 80 putative n=1 Tax=Albugo laibachii Nc14 TaxID=890382 RepID=F0X165_9STRA|nr:intraflagellar Transport protein 80 putative [Albugo laibachii Nc14]|eukprot:CCA27522.1 intraflagellar Transport protein 80 putative [Albugo laibachii Nc14]